MSRDGWVSVFIRMTNEFLERLGTACQLAWVCLPLSGSSHFTHWSKDRTLRWTAGSDSGEAYHQGNS